MKGYIYLVPANVWAIFIAVASLMASKNFNKLHVNAVEIDKVVHFFIYAVLSFLIAWGIMKMKSSKTTLKTLFFILLFSASFGVLMEVLQKLLTASRNYDNYDIIANIGGSIIGCLIFLLKFK